MNSGKQSFNSLCCNVSEIFWQNRDNINSDHRQRILLDRYLETSERLKELYEDPDDLRKNEVAALSGPDELNEFYNRLKQIKEFHKRHPNEVSM